jgi:uncharacterized membrane protein YcaP (DUF421 family)
MPSDTITRPIEDTNVISGLKKHFPIMEALIDGKPLVLLKDGEWQTTTLSKNAGAG